MIVCTFNHTWDKQRRSRSVGICNCNSNILIFKAFERIQRSHSSTEYLESESSKARKRRGEDERESTTKKGDERERKGKKGRSRGWER